MLKLSRGNKIEYKLSPSGNFSGIEYTPIELDGGYFLTWEFFDALVDIGKFEIPEPEKDLLLKFFKGECYLELKFTKDGFSWRESDDTSIIGNVLTVDTDFYEYDGCFHEHTHRLRGHIMDGRNEILERVRNAQVNTKK